MPAPLTRRGALGAAALALASCGGGDPPPSQGPQAGSGAGLLGSLVALEHASVAAWTAIAETLGGEGRRYALAIQARDREHAERVAELVRKLGGEPPVGRSEADYAEAFPRLGDEGDALHFARDLESRQVRAYLDALRSLPEPEQRRTAAAIAAEEATALAVVNVLSGDPAAQGPFVTGTL